MTNDDQTLLKELINHYILRCQANNLVGEDYMILLKMKDRETYSPEEAEVARESMLSIVNYLDAVKKKV
jgi:hypothetical protein